MAGEAQDPSTNPPGSQEGKTYSEQEFHAKVSAELGARLGPIPAETLAMFRENPRMLNEMMMTHALVKNDPDMQKKIQSITGGQQGQQIQLPDVDVNKLMAEAEAESGVQLSPETKKVLSAFGSKLAVAQTQQQRKVAHEAVQEAGPDVVRQMTREQQWDWVRGQKDFKEDELVRRMSRDYLNENFSERRRDSSIPEVTPAEALEYGRKKALELRGGKPYTPGTPAGSSQPRPPFTPSAQATGTSQGNQPQPGGSVPPGGAAKKPSYREVAGQISEAQWQDMIRGVPDKRPSGG